MYYFLYTCAYIHITYIRRYRLLFKPVHPHEPSKSQAYKALNARQYRPAMESDPVEECGREDLMYRIAVPKVDAESFLFFSVYRLQNFIK